MQRSERTAFPHDLTNDERSPKRYPCIVLFDAKNSHCRIYTRRAGVLGRVGHDLEIQVSDFRIHLDEATLEITADFKTNSLRVVDAVEGTTRLPGKLSMSDKRQIEENIADDVLETNRYPTIVFRSTHVEKDAHGYRIRGELEMHGVKRNLDFTARPSEGETRIEVALQQPDYGIAPFKAFAGALRVKPEVVIEVTVPFAG